MAHNLLPMEDMRQEPEERYSTIFPLTSQSEYPCGLCITLTDKELSKLGIEKGELERGDTLHFHALAKVKAVSEYSSEQSGDTCRIELQIEHMSGVEDEDSEDSEDSEHEEGKEEY